LSDLFSGSGPDPAVDRDGTVAAPLAERLRPRTPDEVIGQQHLLGPGIR
jgi:putative ATPase